MGGGAAATGGWPAAVQAGSAAAHSGAGMPHFRARACATAEPARSKPASSAPSAVAMAAPHPLSSGTLGWCSIHQLPSCMPEDACHVMHTSCRSQIIIAHRFCQEPLGAQGASTASAAVTGAGYRG